MSSACANPISQQVLIDYWSGDLAPEESDRVEEHLMGCADCSDESARLATITETLRAMVPAFVTDATVADLRARGLRVSENTLSPGERRTVGFGGDDLLIHRLGGLDLTGADRVRVTLRVHETGDVIVDHPAAPFERASGQVLVACQRHFAAFPPNLVAEVRASDASGVQRLATYRIDHRY